MQPYTAYLDLDGVLVDFISGALRHHKRHIPYKSLDWDFDKKLGMSPEQFWGGLGYEFWLGLGWTREGKDVLKLLEAKFGDSIALITSPPKTPGAVQGKLDWVAREMPRYKRRVFVGARKELLAAPYKILFDDRNENCANFVDAGGCAYKIPRPWNSQAKYEDSLLVDLEEYLNSL